MTNNFLNAVTSGRKIPTGNGAYDALYAADPYAGAQYRSSPWQNFLSGLGFRTGADAWRENMAVQSAEYQAQIAMKQYDEEYNLPINQVARLRAAGINPDLNGGDGINPGEAQQPGQDPSVPMQSTGDESKLMEFANGVLSCVSMAAGLAGTIENVRGMRLDNVLKSITGEQEMSEYANKIFPFLLPENPNDIFDSEGNFSANALSGFLDRVEVFAGKLPKNLQDKFKSNVTTFWNSAPGSAEAYKAWHDHMMSRKSYEIDSRTNFSWDSSDMAIIADELSKLASKVERQGLRSEGAEKQYSADYYDNLSGERAAEAENAENKLNKENFEMTGTLRESLNNIIQRIKSKGEQNKKGAEFNNFILAALSMFQLYMTTQGAPSVRRSATSGVDAKSGNPYSSKSYVLDF